MKRENRGRVVTGQLWETVSPCGAPKQVWEAERRRVVRVNGQNRLRGSCKEAGPKRMS